jgi:hypothetical protein
MYVRRTKAIYTSFEFLTVRWVAKEQVLLDNGASENLIDEETWKTLRIGAFVLPKPITIYNVYGTENKQGKITKYCWLKVQWGNQEHWMRFYLTGIGKDCFILGYPFLLTFNPQIKWQKGQIQGPATKISTIGFKQAQRPLRRTQLWAIRMCKGQPKEGEAIYYRRATTAQDMVHKWQRKQPRSTPEGLPKEYEWHWRVFDEEEAKWFPPSRIQDMKIPLHPDAPKTINCKIYPLTREEEDYVWGFLKEEEEKGYIYPGASPIVSPTFIREKKEAWEKQIIMDLQTGQQVHCLRQ